MNFSNAFPKIEIAQARLPLNLFEQLASTILEVAWAVFVARVGKQHGQQHSAAGRERATRPPQVKRAQMPVSDAFLTRGMRAHHRHRKIHLPRPPTFLTDHESL